MTDHIKEAIEDKIIDVINSSIEGRLIIFKPQEKGMEDYLVVERRGQYKEGKIYLQVNSLVLPSKDINFIKDFSYDQLKTEKNYYLIFAYFNEATQKLEDLVWLIPADKFRDIATIIKAEDGKKILRFESSSDFREKDKYYNFLVKVKDLGKIIFSALKENKQINVKGSVFSEKKKINTEELKEFLFTARQNTYASGSTGVDNPRLLESKQFEFEKGNYFYRDIYFSSSKKFIGQEIIYLDSEPIWGMNYMGDVTNKLNESFLKEALLQLSEKCRLGGKCEYKKREYNYQDKGQGDIAQFSGQEKILVDNKEVYQLNYQGGLIL